MFGIDPIDSVVTAFMNQLERDKVDHRNLQGIPYDLRSPRHETRRLLQQFHEPYLYLVENRQETISYVVPDGFFNGSSEYRPYIYITITSMNVSNIQLYWKKLFGKLETIQLNNWRSQIGNSDLFKTIYKAYVTLENSINTTINNTEPDLNVLRLSNDQLKFVATDKVTIGTDTNEPIHLFDNQVKPWVRTSLDDKKHSIVDISISNIRDTFYLSSFRNHGGDIVRIKEMNQTESYRFDRMSPISMKIALATHASLKLKNIRLHEESSYISSKKFVANNSSMRTKATIYAVILRRINLGKLSPEQDTVIQEYLKEYLHLLREYFIVVAIDMIKENSSVVRSNIVAITPLDDQMDLSKPVYETLKEFYPYIFKHPELSDTDITGLISCIKDNLEKLDTESYFTDNYFIPETDLYVAQNVIRECIMNTPIQYQFDNSRVNNIVLEAMIHIAFNIKKDYYMSVIESEDQVYLIPMYSGLFRILESDLGKYTTSYHGLILLELAIRHMQDHPQTYKSIIEFNRLNRLTDKHITLRYKAPVLSQPLAISIIKNLCNGAKMDPLPTSRSKLMIPQDNFQMPISFNKDKGYFEYIKALIPSSNIVEDVAIRSKDIVEPPYNTAILQVRSRRDELTKLITLYPL